MVSFGATCCVSFCFTGVFTFKTFSISFNLRTSLTGFGASICLNKALLKLVVFDLFFAKVFSFMVSFGAKCYVSFFFIAVCIVPPFFTT